MDKQIRPGLTPASPRRETSGACCGARIPGLNMIEIGGRLTGLIGLDDVLGEIYVSGARPEELDGEEIVQKIAESNYVALTVRHEYREALLREYRVFYEARQEKARAQQQAKTVPKIPEGARKRFFAGLFGRRQMK